MSDRAAHRGGAPDPAGGPDLGLVARIEAHRGDVDLRLEITATPGRPVALVGPNGAGTVSYTHLTLPTICSV